MGFYEDLSKGYDAVFPKNEELVKFLREEIKLNSYVLDMTCSTGYYAIELASRGFKVEGIGLDKSMLDLVRKKSKNVKVNFVECDM